MYIIDMMNKYQTILNKWIDVSNRTIEPDYAERMSNQESFVSRKITTVEDFESFLKEITNDGTKNLLVGGGIREYPNDSYGIRIII
jgi:hypothetical protein